MPLTQQGYYSPYSYAAPETYRGYQAAAPANQGINWVQGEAAAKAYLVAPGSSVMLLDSERDVFYIRSSDAAGMPLPLRAFQFTEITGKQPEMPNEYVTRKEYDDLLGKYEEIIKMLDGMKQPVKQTAKETKNG